MLELRNISKRYVTAGFTQVALDDVSVAFRDNEFVAILGPSGSGKTTLLNIVGGLDRFDSGDLVIDGISTRQYKDRDWDTYRNNRIGFVFQSYNLIPHQTVLANVELALTLSGVSAAERREKARRALAEVGLAEHVNKRPSQLSGGQMQRVAIARALINDPEILLADEPTGALDSKTSVAVMDLLKEVARDRLVVMVTHNPELAHDYATRIVELADGHITADSDPFDPESAPMRTAKQARRTSMSFATALGLSANNLMTKLGRTLMTAFAGSIGIIGIAAILALANGVNEYIRGVEEEMLTVYPLTITSTGFDITSMIAEGAGSSGGAAADADDEVKPAAAEGEVGETKMVNRLFSSVGRNDLASLKRYLDSGESGVEADVNEIVYSLGVTPQIFDDDTSKGIHQVNPDSSLAALGMGSSVSTNSLISMSSSTNVFAQLPGSVELFGYQYDIKAGRWPEAADELVLVLSRNGNISDFLEYAMGLRDYTELERMVSALAADEEVETSDERLRFGYDELLDVRFKLVHASDVYRFDSEYGVWTSRADETEFMRGLIADGEELKIVGIVQPKEDVDATSLSSAIYYTPALSELVMEHAAASTIVRDQLARPGVNVFSGKTFDEEAEDEGNAFDMSSLMSIDTGALQSAFAIDPSAFAFDASSLDFSGVDLSGVQMPAIDPSAFAIDISSVSGEMPSAAEIAALFPELTQEQLARVLASVEIRFDEAGRAKLEAVLTEVAQGYATWAAANPGKSIADYIEQPEIAAKIQQAATEAIDFEDIRVQLIDALAKEMGLAEKTEPAEPEADAGSEQASGQEAMPAAEPAADPAPDPDAPSQEDSERADREAQAITDEVAKRVLTLYQERLAAVLAEQIGTAIQNYLGTAMASYLTQLVSTLETQIARAMQGAMGQLASNMQNAFHIDENAFADAFQFNMDETELAELMASLMSTERASYDANLAKLGYADAAKPARIDIYPKDFDAKTRVISILDGYNDRMRATGEEDKVVSYTDIVGALMTSVTRIIDMISAMLIAFVSISLIVSSIMIAVITYISVLERKKEIGILRSIGASKGNISTVFNAETVIEGVVAGVMGVLITYLISIPANAIVQSAFGVEGIARLPLGAAAILVGISAVLTVVAGLIPASKAANSDPVEALRSE